MYVELQKNLIFKKHGNLLQLHYLMSNVLSDIAILDVSKRFDIYH